MLLESIQKLIYILCRYTVYIHVCCITTSNKPIKKYLPEGLAEVIGQGHT